MSARIQALEEDGIIAQCDVCGTYTTNVIERFLGLCDACKKQIEQRKEETKR